MTRSTAIVITAAALGLLAPSAALAGGWATAGVSPLPDGTAAGGSWRTEITVMQHGRTPLEGVTPAIVITDGAGTETRFAAAATATPGVYAVAVKFPRAGKYTYTVDDGFTNAFPHEFAPVTIREAAATAAPATASGDDGLPLHFWLLAAAAAMLGGAALASAARSRPARRAMPA